MATNSKKPTLGTGSNDINIQAPKVKRDESGARLDPRKDPSSSSYIDLSQAQKVSPEILKARQEELAARKNQGTQANHYVTQVDRKTGKAK